MILFTSVFMLQIAAFSFLQAALMFPNLSIPGTRGKEADCENAYSCFQVNEEEDESLHELKKPFPEMKRQLLLLSCPGRNAKLPMVSVQIGH